MIGEIDHRVFVRGRRIIDVQAAIRQRVAHRGLQVSGKTLISILAQVLKLDAVLNRLALPDDLVETTRAAVQSIVSIVLRDRKGLSIELECSMRDTVSVASDECAEK